MKFLIVLLNLITAHSFIISCGDASNHSLKQSKESNEQILGNQLNVDNTATTADGAEITEMNDIIYETYTFDDQSLSEKSESLAGTGYENGKLFIYSSAVEIARLPVTQKGSFTVQIPIEIHEVQTRRQEWKRCGRLGIERCRRWVDEHRVPVNASVEIWMGGKMLSKDDYASHTMTAGPWSENSDYFRSMLGPVDTLFQGDPFGMVSTMAGLFSGKKLKSAVRTFSGYQTLGRTVNLGSSGAPEEVIVILRRNAGKGSLVVKPFNAYITEYY